MLQYDYPWYSNITRRRKEIVTRVKIEPDFEKATEYFYAMLGYLDSLQKIQYEIRGKIEKTILSEVRRRNITKFKLVISQMTVVRIPSFRSSS